MKQPLTKPLIIIAGLACVAIALFATSGLSNTSASDSEQTQGNAKAVLRVDGMTCGGCISTIKSSLAPFEGIEGIRVDLASGTAEIVYDSTRHQDAGKMAAAITANGYPTSVLRILSPGQLQAQAQANQTKSGTAIAAVGGVDVPRADFEAEMAHAKSRYQMAYGADALTSDQGRRLLDNLKSQIAQRLIDERIQLQEISRSSFTVDRSTVDRQYKAFWQERGFDDEGAFESELRKNGYPPGHFSKRFENRVLINAYLEERVITTNLNDIEKQRRYADWFANARLLAEVNYYDQEIERLVQRPSSAGGCGKSCSVK